MSPHHFDQMSIAAMTFPFSSTIAVAKLQTLIYLTQLGIYWLFIFRVAEQSWSGWVINICFAILLIIWGFLWSRWLPPPSVGRSKKVHQFCLLTSSLITFTFFLVNLYGLISLQFLIRSPKSMDLKVLILSNVQKIQSLIAVKREIIQNIR